MPLRFAPLTSAVFRVLKDQKPRTSEEVAAEVSPVLTALVLETLKSLNEMGLVHGHETGKWWLSERGCSSARVVWSGPQARRSD